MILKAWRPSPVSLLCSRCCICETQTQARSSIWGHKTIKNPLHPKKCFNLWNVNLLLTQRQTASGKWFIDCKSVPCCTCCSAAIQAPLNCPQGGPESLLSRLPSASVLLCPWMSSGSAPGYATGLSPGPAWLRCPSPSRLICRCPVVERKNGIESCSLAKEQVVITSNHHKPQYLLCGPAEVLPWCSAA